MPTPIATVDIREEDLSEEEYDEDADADFNPDKAVVEEDGSSSSDDELEGSTQPVKKAKKRPSDVIDHALDSGDEATIKERKRKRRRKDAEENDESGGEGGLIMTRAQRLAAKIEKKERRRTALGDVTIDVNRLWADLSSLPVGKITTNLSPIAGVDAMDVDGDQNRESAPQPKSNQMITIKRRIEYAGEVTEVEEQVLKNSKEAQKYLAEHPEADPDNETHQLSSSGLQRPLKRPSLFEPNPLGLVKGVPTEKLRPRAPTRLDVIAAEQRAEEERKKKAQRMTTVQKSALDWKGFVDQEGLREELDEYGKSKRGFLAREAFLDRAAGAREDAARDARLKL